MQKSSSSYCHYIAGHKAKCILIALTAAAAADWILIDGIRTYAEGQNRQERLQIQTENIAGDLVFFPLPASGEDPDLTYGYVDSWMAGRSFGGDRHHEGCDIMISENRRGFYPVISMTDGVVESMGWLKLGGWRIGIRAASGNYYYYAHMESYSETLSEGSTVTAGEFLGFVGDSGYGNEGTTGQFAAHLHIGIYVPDESGEDSAVNPYPYLRTLEGKCLTEDFVLPKKDEKNEQDKD